MEETDSLRKISITEYKKCEFDPWGGKIPWRRKWQCTPIYMYIYIYTYMYHEKTNIKTLLLNTAM